MSEITTIGLDLAKHVFQVHGIDAQGTTVLRKRLRRGQVLAFFSRIPRCVVGLEACATAHYWARELGALGHEVRLMPAQYVKAYIKRNKHDAADVEAICEAVGRPTMRFVPVKTAEQQAIWGGTAGAQFDPCYHQACDTFLNNNDHALDVNSDSVAFATLTFAYSTESVNGVPGKTVPGSSPLPAPAGPEGTFTP